jgi:hypothetical protein
LRDHQAVTGGKNGYSFYLKYFFRNAALDTLLLERFFRNAAFGTVACPLFYLGPLAKPYCRSGKLIGEDPYGSVNFGGFE